MKAVSTFFKFHTLGIFQSKLVENTFHFLETQLDMPNQI